MSEEAQKFRYYDPDVETGIHVWFKLFDETGKLLITRNDASCFADISLRDVQASVKKIIVEHKKKNVPYKVAEIKRWIADINELGFPCALIDYSAEHYVFEVLFSHYKYKAHLVATLMLIRTLYEQGICRVPEAYFCVMDANPNADKFQEIQSAHKSSSIGSYHNTNHMITFSSNGQNISKELLFKRYAECGFGLYDSHGVYPNQKYVSYHLKWKGERI